MRPYDNDIAHGIWTSDSWICGDRYRHLDIQKKETQDGKAAKTELIFEESLKRRMASFGGEEQLNWIYGNDIEAVWNSFVQDEKARKIKET